MKYSLHIQTKLYIAKTFMVKLSSGSKKCFGPYKGHFLCIVGSWFQPQLLSRESEDQLRT